MSVLRELGREIAEEQDRRSPGIDRARIAERLVHSSASVGRRPWRWIAASAMAAVVAALVFVSLRKAAPRSLEFRVEGVAQPGRESSWVSAADDPVPIGFSDGSRVVLRQGARARVTRLEATGAELAVEQGPVDVAIVPREGNRWRIDLGPFLVEVTGTRFAVDWNPSSEQFRLQMHEGKVTVTGCAIGSRSFTAGDMLEVSCRDRQFHLRSLAQANEPVQEPEPKPVAANPPVEPSGEPRSTSSANPRWKALVEAGRYREALAAADAAGFDAECQRASAPDLLSLAGAARLAGDAPKARRAYSLLRKRFPADPVAAVAAFNLARVAFDLASDYPAAANWFRTYLREQPSGSLAPEAHGRLVEALQRSGDSAAARSAASDYLAKYPTGPHAEFAKRLLR
jgi:TolA-binding protein